MKIGQKVYTVNAKTNTIDEWTYGGRFKDKNEKSVVMLVNGRKMCALPRRCVYVTRERAMKVAKNFLP